jgi:hypothetical protein
MVKTTQFHFASFNPLFSKDVKTKGKLSKDSWLFFFWKDKKQLTFSVRVELKL